MALQSRSYDALANAQANSKFPISQDTTLIITQPDIDLNRIQNIARRQENLKTLVFRDCKGVSFEHISDLCRSNRNVHQIIFQNCKDFKKDAFEAFRCFDQTLNFLDLSGYHINIEELKSLLRAGFIDLQKAIFQNETDIHNLFSKFYPKCKIEFKLALEAGKNRLKQSRSDYDIQLERKYREHRKTSSTERSKTPDELAEGFHKLSMKQRHSDHAGFRKLSTNSMESMKRKIREERNFCYDKNVYDNSSTSEDSDDSIDSDVFDDVKDHSLSPKKKLSTSSSSSKHSLPKSPSKKSLTKFSPTKTSSRH